ncbi:MAG: AbrB/MazE/SpoVT family DNA-binding domain-containing protein [Gammaproteobacteria bacterium]|nr:AbrB/MazE/SpoVT family DNA-binding domain-containing protein [Gammaproteobacteria bacterium]
MKTVIRKIGNSQGILIPKPVLAEVGFEDEAVMTVEDHALVLRPVKHSPREGWSEASRRLAEHSDDALAWPEFAKVGDEQLEW